MGWAWGVAPGSGAGLDVAKGPRASVFGARRAGETEKKAERGVSGRYWEFRDTYGRHGE